MMKWITVLFVAMLPVVELRGAIPIGLGLGLPLLQTYVVAVLGNMLPVPLIVLFAKKMLEWCMTWPKIGGFFRKIHDKGIKAGQEISQKTGIAQYIALCLFVAIPLPGTGAWTGGLIATLLGMKFWPSVIAIALGVIFAGILVGAASAGLFGAFGAVFAVK